MSPAAVRARLVVLAVLCGAAAAAPLLGAQPGPSRERSPSVRGADLELLREVRALVGHVEELRGTTFASPPVAVRASAEARRAAARERVAAAYPEGRLAARGRAWAALGLGGERSPATLATRLAEDLEGAALDGSASRLLVDPALLPELDFVPTEDADTLLMAAGLRRDEPSLAHVLIHLLQRQRAGGDPLGGTTDRLLAAAAGREGEANLVAVHHLIRGVGVGEELLDLGLDPAEVLDGALLPPPDPASIVGRLVEFVYQEGFAAVSAAYRAGGWEAVERLLASRTTTRDLLHPERAALGRPALPPARLGLPPQYRLADRDALGELAIVVLVSTRTGKDDLALVAGDGWIGDALYRWEPEADPAAGITLWATRWDGEAAAADFEYAFLRTLRSRFPETEPVPAGDGQRVLATAGAVFRVARGGTEVRVRVAPPEIDRRLEETAPASAPR